MLLKNYKVKVYKYGCGYYDMIIFKARNFDHLCLVAEDFCRKSSLYKEWSFIGEDNEI